MLTSEQSQFNVLSELCSESNRSLDSTLDTAVPAGLNLILYVQSRAGKPDISNSNKTTTSEEYIRCCARSENICTSVPA